MQKKDRAQIVILMAGNGSRFKEKGYTTDKPFIKVDNKTFLELTLESFHKNNSFILVMKKEFLSLYKDEIKEVSKKYKIKIFTTDKMTAGAASTALFIWKQINNKKPVIFADVDNFYLEKAAQKFLDFSIAQKFDAAVSTFNSSSAKFSYIKYKNNLVLETKEKEVVSDQAISGLYFFKSGKKFIDYCISLHIYDQKTKNEFYLSNIYNLMIEKKEKIGWMNIETKNYISLGTPEQLEEYLNKK
ncbi:sugar phosphate nucleotidyltransferase [Mesomycoplasma molare]|uniref:NTP transferase domain-containing protein n=1 Tax=Mesomycoplasma molare TaxID=171288 RepID=A0ABY5TU52_9BACT|nr:sugar phosphate nucleotidyltransferase [Mesomycoplasma molare]UWD34197.1 NTP transferase domain-containing protein [Mesomycoplasma molare]